MIRTIQSVESVIHTTQNDSLSRADRAGSAIGTDRASATKFAWCSDIFANIFGGDGFADFALHTFMYRPYSLLNLSSDCFSSDCLNRVKPAVNQLAEQPVWKCSIRQSLDPKTIHRSRERRQLAMFSF